MLKLNQYKLRCKKYEMPNRYNKLKASEFKAKVKFSNEFDICENEWKIIYMLPFQILVENKIIAQDYRHK